MEGQRPAARTEPQICTREAQGDVRDQEREQGCSREKKVQGRGMEVTTIWHRAATSTAGLPS